jgi:hypothetical protein
MTTACSGSAITTNMKPPKSSKPRRRTAGWLAGSALLALSPKCFLCLAAYAGFGTVLGLGGPELCGDGPSVVSIWVWWLALAGAALGAAALGVFTAGSKVGGASCPDMTPTVPETSGRKAPPTFSNHIAGRRISSCAMSSGKF